MQPSPAAPSPTSPIATAPAIFPWWGRYALAEGQGGIWEVGPLRLTVERRAREWRVSSQSAEPSAEGTASRLTVRCPVPAGELPEGGSTARFATQATTHPLVVEPVLPDRPVVARPDRPFHLLGGDEVALFVTLPVWARVRVAGDRQLVEVPTHRLADTWFGASTRFGELCYATRTAARLELANVPVRPHMAICRVRLTNLAAAPLLVERLSLPVHHLDLFWHRDRGLWTRGIEVERAADGRLASLHIGSGPPDAVFGAEPVSPARQPELRRTLVRALEALLG